MISLFLFILIFAMSLFFIIFNLGNTCDVSLGFMTFKDIPVFLTALFSFALGMLFVLPLIFSMKRKRKLKAARAQAENPQNEGAQTENLRIPDPKIQPPPKKLFGRKSSKKSDFASEEDKVQKEANPYGID